MREAYHRLRSWCVRHSAREERRHSDERGRALELKLQGAVKTLEKSYAVVLVRALHRWRAHAGRVNTVYGLLQIATGRLRLNHLACVALAMMRWKEVANAVVMRAAWDRREVSITTNRSASDSALERKAAEQRKQTTDGEAREQRMTLKLGLRAVAKCHSACLGGALRRWARWAHWVERQAAVAGRERAEEAAATVLEAMVEMEEAAKEAAERVAETAAAGAEQVAEEAMMEVTRRRGEAKEAEGARGKGAQHLHVVGGVKGERRSKEECASLSRSAQRDLRRRHQGAEEGGEDRGEDGGGAGERTRDELATLEEVRFLLDLQAKTAEERRGAAKVLRIRRRREYAY
jgi:hypothetical protein